MTAPSDALQPAPLQLPRLQSPPLQSTVFRLALAAVTTLALAAALVAYLVGSNANGVLTQATEAALQADAAHLRSELTSGGFDALAVAVAERSRLAVGAVYYLADAGGRKRAGNLAERPQEIQGSARAGVFRYHLPGAPMAEPRLAAGLVIVIDGGSGSGGASSSGILVVGRNIDGQRALISALNRSLGLGLAALVVLGLGGGYLLARRLLQRIDGMSGVAQAIMAGRLEGRLPLAGSGDELDRLAAQLNAMLERIERLMSGLREVSDNIAHDLKTPLNRLRNSAETALADPRGAVAWRDGLERTIEEADNLISTFNALLLIARLEAGAIAESLEDLDLAAIAADVAELYAPVAEDRGLSLELETQPPVPVRANRQLVGQAIANLVDNAIKYSAAAPGAAAGGQPQTITVTARAAGGQAILTVADQGPGIAAADRARALKRFVRLEASRTRPGTGLGLSLVAAVAQLHHGTVRLEDNQPGLRVILTLPLAGAPANAQVPETATGTATAAAKTVALQPRSVPTSAITAGGADHDRSQLSS